MLEIPEHSTDAEELGPVVRGVVAHVLGQGRNHPDVEDCAHEALRRAIEGRHRLRDGEPLRPWVIGIARHVALDLLRARRRERRRLIAADDKTGEPLERVPDSTPGADQQLEQAERSRRVRLAMQELPPDQRRALELFHLEGLGYKEIAGKLGVPMATVGTWIARGRKRIAAALQGVET